MNICVTGGAGFIGSEIVRQLVASQHEVSVIDSLTYAGDLFNLMEVRSKIQFFQVDINDKQEIKEVFNSVKVDLIINCAAETHVDNSISDPGIFFQTNIRWKLQKYKDLINIGTHKGGDFNDDLKRIIYK